MNWVTSPNESVAPSGKSGVFEYTLETPSPGTFWASRDRLVTSVVLVRTTSISRWPADGSYRKGDWNMISTSNASGGDAGGLDCAVPYVRAPMYTAMSFVPVLSAKIAERPSGPRCVTERRISMSTD